jgi:hypothetical protein
VQPNFKYFEFSSEIQCFSSDRDLFESALGKQMLLRVRTVR